jgi:hypothetical protein
LIPIDSVDHGIINRNEIFIFTFIFYLRRLPSNSSLYQTKHTPKGHQTYQQSISLGLSDQNEHLIELPSDIFLTSRTGDYFLVSSFFFNLTMFMIEPIDSPQRHHRIRKTNTRHILKDSMYIR